MIALSTGSLYSYGTARVFELAARVGYDGVEVIVDHRWDTRQPAYLRRLVADHGSGRGRRYRCQHLQLRGIGHQ